ncbi:uncharacterized protein KY384_003388 [Bacidia gigantensis]|uniref:uncharacterized protein n=1 Tax=Bacidia gigantensis TaxID=2732470 RepID=UPI001D045D8B|nr:uncharacterized protein KY384_003388 [Bacidia gigantensis]KAG8531756.1 hypothetical protein KY384_003388 [Bacidia gigantensis]
MGSERIDPAKHFFQGRKPGPGPLKDDDIDSTLGGLLGKTFPSCCPPGVQPNTRIIAICGIADWVNKHTVTDIPPPVLKIQVKSPVKNVLLKSKDFFSKSRRDERKELKVAKDSQTTQRGMASPHHDGWFFSDLFLFYQLFEGVGSNQLWFTCESPSRLVAKYDKYLHGGPNDRRVVMEQVHLDAVRQQGNFRVSSRGDLLEDFLRTLRGEFQLAQELNQPVLLLIFGHGDMDTYGVCIGGETDEESAPRLRVETLKSMLSKFDISVTLMMTSCHSGGWLYTPDLNVSGLTSAGPGQESFSWPNTVGGRAHGSLWATAVTYALIKFEDERLTQPNPLPQKGFVDPELTQTSSTFANLSRVIRETLIHDVASKTYQHQVRFAAQDDAWEDEWRARSGIPLVDFRHRWTSLQQVSGPNVWGDKSMKANAPKHQDSTPGYYNCKHELNEAQARSIVADLAEAYMSSFPGRDEAGSNHTAHALAKQMISKEPMSNGEVRGVNNTLRHRMDKMKVATAIVQALGVDFPNCEDFSVEQWQEDIWAEGSGKGKGKANRHPKEELFYSLFRQIVDSQLLPPQDNQLSYPKAERYLAIAFVEKFEVDEARRMIEVMKRGKDTWIQDLMALIRNERQVRQAARQHFETLGKRLRSPSPRKRGPIPSFGQLTID